MPHSHVLPGHRLALALLISLLAHGALLSWHFGRGKAARPVHGSGLVHAWLRQPGTKAGGPDGIGHQPGAAQASRNPEILATPETGTTETHQENTAPTPTAREDALPRQGWQERTLFHWRPPPDDGQGRFQMQAMLAQQRGMQAAAIAAETATLVERLATQVKTRIECSGTDEIVCRPAPEEDVRPLLERLLRLNHQSRQLGLGDGALSLDFGGGNGIFVVAQ